MEVCVLSARMEGVQTGKQGAVWGRGHGLKPSTLTCSRDRVLRVRLSAETSPTLGSERAHGCVNADSLNIKNVHMPMCVCRVYTQKYIHVVFSELAIFFKRGYVIYTSTSSAFLRKLDVLLCALVPTWARGPGPE